MREYEMEVLEKYELEVNSTRRIRGAFYCDTKEGTMLLKETKISERRVPLLYLILNRLEKQGYLVDTPVFSKEGNLVQNSRDGTRYLMKKWYPGEECNLKREEDSPGQQENWESFIWDFSGMSRTCRRKKYFRNSRKKRCRKSHRIHRSQFVKKRKLTGQSCHHC